MSKSIAKLIVILLLILMPSIVLAQEQPININEFIRSVTVQVVVSVEKYYRSLTWYQEINTDGSRSEWKVRHGKWEEPERIEVVGSGFIVYSGSAPYGNELIGATYILTNAHVVSLMIREDARGSAYKPLDVFLPDDIILSTNPPGIAVKEGARPIEQQYFVINKDYVSIRHSEDQLYEVRAKIIAYDELLDVALLELGNVWGLPYAKFRKQPAKVAEEVIICGAPLGIGFSLDYGKINQTGLNLGISGGISWNRQIKISIAAAPGSSGSGIFDAQTGEIVAQLHGCLVYQGNYIAGGQLANEGLRIAEWLRWSGWAFVVE